MKTERGRQDLGHMLLLGSVGGVLWGSWAKAELDSSNQKSRVLVSFVGVLSKGCIRRRQWEAGELLITRAVGEATSGTCIYLRLCRQLSKAYTCMRG